MGLFDGFKRNNSELVMAKTGVGMSEYLAYAESLDWNKTINF